MPWVLHLLVRVAVDVWSTVAADWPYLLVSIVAAAAVPVYLGTDRLGAWMSRRRWVAISAAVLLATLTPFCSCGTTAIVLGMLATRTPWAPIVAFMVASPLTSPEELFLSAGLFGWPFALIFFAGAAALGFAAGAVTDLVARTGWLADQARMRAAASAPRSCAVATGCADGTAPPARGAPGVAVRAPILTRLRAGEFAHELRHTGSRLGLYFLGYGALGYLVIELLPTGLLTSMLGGHSPASVALAAALGIPVYITTEASLPMVAALVHGGLGLGPAMAFLVTGAGTSIGAITGAFVIARARVIGLVVGLLFAGALILGWLTGATLG
ncbi:MAG: permease [Trebonia sp.]